MRNLILFDDDTRDHLLPLTYTRPACLLRCGVLTIQEKWEAYLNGTASYITSEYLTRKFRIAIQEENLVINGTVLPNARLVKLIGELQPNEALISDGDLVAANIPGNEFDAIIDGSFGEEIAGYKLTETPMLQIRRSWDLLRYLADEIQCDFDLLTKDRESYIPDSTNTIIGERDELFCAEGVSIQGAMINTSSGPVYIDRNAIVLEGSLIKGPVAICEGAVVKMGAKIYGPTVIGPYAKVGGEVSHSIVHGYSNKAHDGYLGNSILGEWCNLGAGTNVSNLKNTYQEVRIWNYSRREFEESGQQFLGVILGDHTKCGISTMLNTGTVAGVSSNIFGAGFPEKFIPSFAWGNSGTWQTYRLEKAIEVASLMMQRRNIEFTDLDREIFRYIHDQSSEFRSWD